MCLKPILITLSITATLCCLTPLSAQSTAPIDPVRLDSLVATRIKMPVPTRVNGNYVIQLFYGDKVDAERIKAAYDAKDMQWESVMKYEQPFHKVWIGKFKSKADAERVMTELRSDYPKAFVLLPKS